MDGVWGRVISGSMYSCNCCTCIGDVPAVELNFYPSIPSLYARLLIIENRFRPSWTLQGWTSRYRGITGAKYMYLQKKFLLVLWKGRWKICWKVCWKVRRSVGRSVRADVASIFVLTCNIIPNSTNDRISCPP
jgi:hypothetical protein